MNFDSSTQNIAWFRDRYLETNLTIKPPYQRKPVWAARQKCYLIESILKGLPVPEIYIQQTTTAEGKTNYAIVDGQQRIRTVLQFIGSETDPAEQDYNKFVLDKLPTGSSWRNLTFNELPDETKKTFYGYKFAVRYLNTESDDEVRDMFQRLNRYLTPLKPQELRNATFTGPSVKLVLGLADGEYWAENRIVTPAAIRRMSDVEFVSELLIGALHGPQGGSPAAIDAYYEQYEDYDDEFPEQRRGELLFDQTLNLIQRILPNIKATRWANKTDFYTLFVALAALIRSKTLPTSKIAQVRAALENFAGDVDQRLADPNAGVTQDAISYARAHEKGANDKMRRAHRHAALSNVIGGWFKEKNKRR
jgi:hypothetical protein